MSGCARLALVAFVLAAFACGGEADAPAPARESASSSSAAASDVAQGGSRVVYADGRVTLTSRGALLAAVLEKLGREAGFTLQGSLPGRTVEVHLEDAALVDALSTLLADEAWSLEYVPQPGGGHALTRLHIGGGGPKPAVRLRERRMGQLPTQLRTPQARREPPAPIVRPRGDYDPDAYEADLLRRLESGDPVERAEAVGELDLDGEQLRRLIDFALTDPAVEVRLAALEELEGEETWAALNALVAALQDRDSRVVLRTIEAISFLDDETLAPKLRPLLDHDDPDVRKAAEEAIAELTE